MQALAKFDFVATEQDELSFSNGTMIKIISMEDDANWFKAEIRGDIGYVPKTYIEMLPHPWFYGKISRLDSEKLLLAERPDGRPFQPDGAFLVRYSESSPGDLSISVKCQKTVQHYKILRSGCKYYLWVVKFDSVNELIDYHRKSSISRTSHLPLFDMMHVNRTRSRSMLASGATQPSLLNSNVQFNSTAATSSIAGGARSTNMEPPMSNRLSQQKLTQSNVIAGPPQFAAAAGNFAQHRTSQPTNQRPSMLTSNNSALMNSSTGMPKFVQAAYDFNPQDENEISIRQGDIIRVINKYDDNWLTGELHGKVGLLPSTYVCPYP